MQDIRRLNLKAKISGFFDRLAGPIFIVPALLFFIPFIAIPVLGTFFFVFQKWGGTGLHTMEFVGLSNFEKMFSDPVFYIAVKNNFSLGFSIVVGSILLGLITALIIAEEGRFSTFFQVVFMIPLPSRASSG